MRLWHQKIIPQLPRQQLLGQHRECAALRGRGWGRPHSTVNYVFTHDPALLVAYHYIIIEEMRRRGYNPDSIWENPHWRGSALGEQIGFVDKNLVNDLWMNINQMGKIVYPEHNDNYLQECIDNLKGKGVEIRLD